MLRKLFGFAVLAVVTIFLLKVVFGLFGLVLGLLGRGAVVRLRGLLDLSGPQALRPRHGCAGAGDGFGALGTVRRQTV